MDLIKSPGKCLDGNVLCIVLILCTNKLEAIDIVPKRVQQAAEGNLIAGFGLLDGGHKIII
jgi:hypothetical protein